MTEDFIKCVGAFALAGVLIFAGPLIGVLAGGFSGWVVSVMAPVWVPTGLASVGIHVASSQLVELGAAFGFIAGFFGPKTA